ncbi:MAG: sulfur oxidation c-type cytochrome SoxA [Marivita sp.]|jgi:sulfur-oxidizing protein SoxA|uniref:sulfur oxidation c-type cytochrome SoxA n=1 Tax=Marivita sp. TaxID=2003365 RepID=UPI001B0728C0|nr:sulfur oxidation c-type cytochrome SoxA [Marivita sp.]MBO6885317.1 sulfur oxidation c-type cytochrome SoxA [Marivita sp.]
MKYKAMTAFAALAISAPMLFAGGADDDTLSIDGEVMISKTAAPAHMAETGIDTIISGWHFREDDTQAMQTDTFDNPGMIAVDQAIDAWNTVEGTAEKSCASCHEGPESLAGVRAVYPKWNAEAGEMRTLAMQVNNCRTEQMGAEAYKYDGAQMTAMEALISVQSRGMPVNVAIDGPAAEYYEKGKEIYYTRYGQLELSCANCHEQNYGNYIRADHLSQGQINGFPTYRLKNAGLVQTHNRFRGCIRDTRAETFAVGSPEFIALEVYVASRGNGLSVEGPSVRQ